MTLPAGWEAGLTPEAVAAVLRCERLADHGIFRIQPTRHHKGYYRVSLPRRHPYARSGTNFLHRYVFERHLGRRLQPWEHAHHRPGAAHDTVNVRDLELLEETEHGRYHFGQRLSCGGHLALWKARDIFGRFLPLPTEDELALNLRAATGDL